jgi:hypothetical protein
MPTPLKVIIHIIGQMYRRIISLAIMAALSGPNKEKPRSKVKLILRRSVFNIQ